MANRRDGLCPSCGKRPKYKNGYCAVCFKHYKAVRRRVVAATKLRADGSLRRRDMSLDADTMVNSKIPPEVYDAIKERGWDPDRLTALALAMFQIELGTETQPDGRVLKCLKYHDERVYY